MPNKAVLRIENNDNPAPFEITVVLDDELDHYTITLRMLGKNFSRIERTRVRAVQYAKKMNADLEAAFFRTFEDNS
jgi:hypothetical protein